MFIAINRDSNNRDRDKGELKDVSVLPGKDGDSDESKDEVEDIYTKIAELKFNREERGKKNK